MKRRFRLFALSLAGWVALTGCASSAHEGSQISGSTGPPVQKTPPIAAEQAANAGQNAETSPASSPVQAEPAEGRGFSPAPTEQPAERDSSAPSAVPESSPAHAEQAAISKILILDGQEGWALGQGTLTHWNEQGAAWETVLPDGVNPGDTLLGADFRDRFLGFAYYVTGESKPKLVAAHQTQDGSGKMTGWKTAVLPTEEPWEVSPDAKAYTAIQEYAPSYMLLTSGPAAGLMYETLYRTDDRGAAWSRVGNISNGIAGYPNGIVFRNNDEGWITAMNHGQDDVPLYRTQDGGRTWKAQPLDVPDEFKQSYANAYPPAFDQEDDHHAIFIAEFVHEGNKAYVPYETRDGGDTWKPIPYRLNDIQGPPVLHFDDLLMGRAISLDGRTIYTMDTYHRGDWQAIKPNVSLAGADQFYVRDDGYGWVFGEGKLRTTNDGGKTWSSP